jgi:hypothetical protein
MSITFVSALLNLYEDRPEDKSLEKRITFFNELQESGIYIHLFLSPEYKDKIILKNGVIEYISLEDLDTYHIAPSGLPYIRQTSHDTRNFMILMNAKTEFVYRAMKSRDTSYYAWIDFNITHVFKQKNTILYLKNLKILTDKCLYIPGCLDKNPYFGFDHVNWRFCGGFFLGDKESILHFYHLHKEIFPTIPKLSWEVNVWAYMENFNWKNNWYAANHNDSIIKIPHSKIILIPSNLIAPWNGPLSRCLSNGPIVSYVNECLQPYSIYAIFIHSDGIMGQSEYDRMICSLNRPDESNTPESIYSLLESQATKTIICMLCSRQLYRHNLLLLPLDDHTFQYGLSNILSELTLPIWEDRCNVAVWRGGSSGFDRPSIRMKVVESLHMNKNTDVRFTSGGWPINDNIIPPEHFKNRMTIQEQVYYKYIFIIDGNCIASNHQWVFGTGSVPVMITHPDNNYWFKPYLKPMINYVSIEYDLSDLDEKLEWLITHDDDAKNIAKNAVEMANRIFTPEFQRLYVYESILKIQ